MERDGDWTEWPVGADTAEAAAAVWAPSNTRSQQGDDDDSLRSTVMSLATEVAGLKQSMATLSLEMRVVRGSDRLRVRGSPQSDSSDSSRATAPVGTVCAHQACNVDRETNESIATMRVTNASMLRRSSEVYSWSSHLGSTLLQDHAHLNEELDCHLGRFFNRYTIMWCGARMNRFFLIKCNVCGHGCYGQYDDKQSPLADARKAEAIQALADFIGFVIAEGEIQV